MGTPGRGPRSGLAVGPAGALVRPSVLCGRAPGGTVPVPGPELPGAGSTLGVG